MNWNYVNTGFQSGQYNMDYDESLAQTYNKTNEAILRFYGWSPYTVSIGFHQNIQDFNLQKLEQDGIGIVRRPTGGRAILHAHELTYSVVIPCNEQMPKQIYRLINEGLLLGLRTFGIDAKLSGKDENLPSFYKHPESVSCFAVSAKNEIQYHGKKLAGSAQRRFGNVILQHGSILLGAQHRDIIHYIAEHIREHHEIIEKSLVNNTTEAETILNRSVSFEEIVPYIKQGFEEIFQISTLEEIHSADNHVLIS